MYLKVYKKGFGNYWLPIIHKTLSTRRALDLTMSIFTENQRDITLFLNRGFDNKKLLKRALY